MTTGKKLSIILMALMLLISVMPVTVFAMDEQMESEAMENYDAAKKNMENIYYHTLEDINKNELLDSDKPLSERLYLRFYQTFVSFADIVPKLSILSIFIGVILVAISRKNKRIQRFAIIFLIILIPLISWIIVLTLGSSPFFKYR